jgi:kynurenine formamidase
MKLDKLFVNPIKIMCFPMMVKGLDGAPVSIIAEL